MGILLSILYFGGRVPRYFIFHFFRGTFSSCSYIMFHIFLTFWWSRTPTFHFSLFSGYIFVFLIHYVSYFPCFLVFAYPDISFLTFFGVHFRFTHTLCFIFSLLFSGFVPRYFIFRLFRGTFPSFSYIMFHIFLAFWWSRTPIFHFLNFFGVHFFLAHTLCFIFPLLFSGRVPRYFIFNFFRGTHLLVHHLLWLQHTPIHQKRTPTFYF